MLRSSLKEVFCLGAPVKGPGDLQGALSCSLDSRLPDVQVPPRPCAEIVIDIGQQFFTQGDLPPNVLWRIVRLVEIKELKSLHRVNRAWRDAVCQGLGTLNVKDGALSLLHKFPNVDNLGLEGVKLKNQDLLELRHLGSFVLRGCTFESSLQNLLPLKGLKRLRLINVRSSGQEDCNMVLAKLTNLTFLEWSRTQQQSSTQGVSDALSPSSISLSTLTSLKVLLLSDSFQGVQPKDLGKMSALQGLRRLAISGGVMREAFTTAISMLRHLESLELTNCHDMTDGGVQSLSVLTDLTKLDLRQSGRFAESLMTDRAAVQLSTLINLQYLNLAGHPNLTTEGVSHISGFTGLSSLCLAGLGLWTGGADFLRGLTRLQFLNISRSLLTPQQLDALAPLTALQHLNLSETYLNDEAAKQVARMTGLETLKISYCPMGNPGLRLITASCPKLSRVTLEGCWISTWCLLCIVLRHPHLKYWKDDNFLLPQWMAKLDVILIAQTQPLSRKLRALYQVEDSLVLTLVVGCGVMVFAVVYTGVLLLLFTVVFLVPMFILGIVSLAIILTALAAKALAGASWRAPDLLHRLESLLFSGPDSESGARQERLEDLL